MAFTKNSINYKIYINNFHYYYYYYYSYNTKVYVISPGAYGSKMFVNYFKNPKLKCNNKQQLLNDFKNYCLNNNLFNNNKLEIKKTGSSWLFNKAILLNKNVEYDFWTAHWLSSYLIKKLGENDIDKLGYCISYFNHIIYTYNKNHPKCLSEFYVSGNTRQKAVNNLLEESKFKIRYWEKIKI